MDLREPCCSNCGSSRIGAIQRGIDNWPVARCFNCGPTTTLIPEAPGAKRDRAIASAAKKAIGSKKAIHTVLRPLIERSQYRPRGGTGRGTVDGHVRRHVLVMV